jgi:hypothetical protein
MTKGRSRCSYSKATMLPGSAPGACATRNRSSWNISVSPSMPTSVKSLSFIAYSWPSGPMLHTFMDRILVSLSKPTSIFASLRPCGLRILTTCRTCSTALPSCPTVYVVSSSSTTALVSAAYAGIVWAAAVRTQSGTLSVLAHAGNARVNRKTAQAAPCSRTHRPPGHGVPECNSVRLFECPAGMLILPHPCARLA